MGRFITQGLIFTAIFLFGLAILWLLEQQTQSITLKVAAGSKSSDSYQLMKVITEKLHQHQPRLHFELLETSGSKQNMQLLDLKQVDLIAVQADIVHAESARLMASLYADYYQLLVRQESGIEQFSDLEGKQIALAEKGSGQYRSFLLLAKHYGLNIQSMNLLSLSTQAAQQALSNSQVDAVFRVRALTHSNTRQLLSQDDINIVAIKQAKNLQIKNPALEHDILPKGIYQTTPAIPANDLDTLSVQRLLITHKDLDPRLIYDITRLLFAVQYDISKQAPLARFIQNPHAKINTKTILLPLHQGSELYYKKRHFSFLQTHKLPIAIMLLLALIFIFYLRRLQQRQRLAYRQSFHNQAMLLLEEAQQQLVTSFILQQKLTALLKKATQAHSKRQLSSDDFQVFSFHWQRAYDAVNNNALKAS